MRPRPGKVPLVIVAIVFCLIGSAPASSDVALKWAGPDWYNPSLVVHEETFISSLKFTRHTKAKGKAWWMNTLHMCEGSSQNLQGLSCAPFEPWQGHFKECEFDERVRAGKLDTSGLGDVKVWRWPGKGTYAIFGRKPERNQSSVLCKGFIVYHQWIALVKGEDGLKAGDPWMLEKPLALLPPAGHTYPETALYAMEKNWMPFVHEDQEGMEHLYVTYMVQPHTVFEVLPGGTTEHRWTTHDTSLMSKFAAFDVHGGPPLAHVPKELSASGEPYYLGIMHHIEKYGVRRHRHYRHFAFKVSPQPPFSITAISDELPLVFNASKHVFTALITFVSGLYVSPSSGSVYITYGASDIQARALTMTVQELEGLFTGQIAFLDVPVLHGE